MAARVACIDLGSSRIAVAILSFGARQRPRLLGTSWVPSAGIVGGNLADLVAAGRAVAAALEDAERAARCHVGEAAVSIAGPSVHASLRHGQLSFGREPVRIGRKHAARAVNSVVVGGADDDEEFLHVIPRRFTLDGAHSVRNPIGMPAARLEVETHAIVAKSAALRSALRCVQDQGLNVREVVFGPLAAAEAALTPQEREAGAIVLDLGAANTSAVVYVGGSPAVTLSVPLGGRQITSDVAMVLRVTLRQAERLKRSFGRAGLALIGDTELEVPDDEAIGVAPVSHRLLCEVIQARLEEIFEHVMRAIAETGFAQPIPAGVVLTGGGATLPDADTVARRLFALPARVATVRFPGADGSVLSPEWATIAGLAHWMQRGRSDQLPEGTSAQRSGVNVGRFVRQLLPLGGE